MIKGGRLFAPAHEGLMTFRQMSDFMKWQLCNVNVHFRFNHLSVYLELEV